MTAVFVLYVSFTNWGFSLTKMYGNAKCVPAHYGADDEQHECYQLLASFPIKCHCCVGVNWLFLSEGAYVMSG